MAWFQIGATTAATTTSTSTTATTTTYYYGVSLEIDLVSWQPPATDTDSLILMFSLLRSNVCLLCDDAVIRPTFGM